MTMRLLNKREVDVAKSRDKQMAITEGLKLAKRVDELREILPQEEASLEKWRSETVTKISEEIAAREQKRSALDEEIVILEARRALALEPLAEYKKSLAVERTELDVRETAAKAERADLDTYKVLLDGREEFAAYVEAKANVVHTNARTAYAEASTMRSEAQRKNDLAETLLTETTKQSKVVLDRTSEREEFVKQREKAVFAREEANRKETLTLAREWSKLKDREATLERNLKRK